MKSLPYNKAIVAAVTGFFGVFVKGMADGKLTAGEIAACASAAVVSGVTVYFIPNGKKAQSVGE